MRSIIRILVRKRASARRTHAAEPSTPAQKFSRDDTDDAYPNEVATAAMFAVKRDGVAERAPLLRNGARDSTGVCV